MSHWNLRRAARLGYLAGYPVERPGQTKEARPASGHPYQQGPVTTPQSETLRCAPQGDVELMTQKEVLDFKPVPRLEKIGHKGCKQVDDRKHRIG
jgi:hypothetical protein